MFLTGVIKLLGKFFWWLVDRAS